jgi:hypothetical protein
LPFLQQINKKSAFEFEKSAVVESKKSDDNQAVHSIVDVCTTLFSSLSKAKDNNTCA